MDVKMTFLMGMEKVDHSAGIESITTGRSRNGRMGDGEVSGSNTATGLI
jgi:hypothetical protein